MPMAADEIETLIRAALPDAQVTITDLAGDGEGAALHARHGRLDERQCGAEKLGQCSGHGADSGRPHCPCAYSGFMHRLANLRFI